MLGLFLAGLGLVSGMDCVITDVTSVEVSTPSVKVRDVVTMGCLSASSAAATGNHVIVRLPDVGGEMILTRQDIQSLVRRQIPALGKRLIVADPGRVSIVYRPVSPSEEVLSANCSELVSPVRAGEIVAAMNTRRVSCSPGRRLGLFQYDAHSGGVRASEMLQSGTYLGRVYFGKEVVAERGDELQLCSSAGPVNIRRTVEALQPVQVGANAAFVRGSDGKVFATHAFCPGSGESGHE